VIIHPDQEGEVLELVHQVDQVVKDHDIEEPIFNELSASIYP
jgi:hypothetical protein